MTISILNGDVPHYATIPDWCRISGVRRTSTYELLSTGKLRAVKVGHRTLIDVRAGLEWMGSLPAAEINVPSLQAR